jgi:hypothetical protein
MEDEDCICNSCRLESNRDKEDDMELDFIKFEDKKGLKITCPYCGGDDVKITCVRHWPFYESSPDMTIVVDFHCDGYQVNEENDDDFVACDNEFSLELCCDLDIHCNGNGGTFFRLYKRQDATEVKAPLAAAPEIETTQAKAPEAVSPEAESK